MGRCYKIQISIIQSFYSGGEKVNRFDYWISTLSIEVTRQLTDSSRLNLMPRHDSKYVRFNSSRNRIVGRRCSIMLENDLLLLSDIAMTN